MITKLYSKINISCKKLYEKRTEMCFYMSTFKFVLVFEWLVYINTFVYFYRIWRIHITIIDLWFRNAAFHQKIIYHQLNITLFNILTTNINFESTISKNTNRTR